MRLEACRDGVAQHLAERQKHIGRVRLDSPEVNVSAMDKSTGKKNNITITSSGGLAQDEIDRMVQEAESMKDADEKQKNSVQVRRGCFRAFPREFSVF